MEIKYLSQQMLKIEKLKVFFYLKCENQQKLKGTFYFRTMWLSSITFNNSHKYENTNKTYRESFPGNAEMRINLDFKITTK